MKFNIMEAIGRFMTIYLGGAVTIGIYHGEYKDIRFYLFLIFFIIACLIETSEDEDRGK